MRENRVPTVVRTSATFTSFEVYHQHDSSNQGKEIQKIRMEMRKREIYFQASIGAFPVTSHLLKRRECLISIPEPRSQRVRVAGYFYFVIIAEEYSVWLRIFFSSK